MLETIVYLDVGSVQALYNGMPAHFADSPKTEAVYKMLSVSLPSPAPEAIAKLYRPASIVDKTHIHTRYSRETNKDFKIIIIHISSLI